MNSKTAKQLNGFINKRLVSLILNGKNGILIDFENAMFFETRQELEMIHKIALANGTTCIKTTTKHFYNAHLALAQKLNFNECADAMDYVNKCRNFVVEYFTKTSAFIEKLKRK
jgi:hypothetical protein